MTYARSNYSVFHVNTRIAVRQKRCISVTNKWLVYQPIIKLSFKCNLPLYRQSDVNQMVSPVN